MPAQQSEQRAFRAELPHDAGARRTQRAAHGDFPLTVIARASNRFTRFTQPISSTAITANISALTTQRKTSKPPPVVSKNVAGRALRRRTFLWLSGTIDAKAFCTRAISASICFAVISGFRRHSSWTRVPGAGQLPVHGERDPHIRHGRGNRCPRTTPALHRQTYRRRRSAENSFQGSVDPN